MEFAFTALNAQGIKVTDRIQAENSDQAITRLQANGLTVLDLSQKAIGASAEPAKAGAKADSKKGGLLGSRSKKIKMEQAVAMSRELAIMIETGVPIVEAISSLAEHSDHPGMREILHNLMNDLNEGKGLAESMAQYPKLFSTLYVSMVRTAEVGGSLNETLNHAAEYLETALEMRRKVKGAMAYPGVLLAVTIMVLIFMLLYIVPQFNQLFSKMNAEVPLQTKFLLAVSLFLKANWWLIPLSLGGAFWGMKTLLSKPQGKMMFAKAVLKIPVVGVLATKVAVARLLRALGTLLNSGVSLLVSLEMAAQSTQNPVFDAAVLHIKSKVEEGQTLTASMKETGVFPSMVCQMVAVGEKAGQMSEVLLRVSRYYEREVDAALKTVSSIIEPVMIVVLGVIIGGMAISIIGPIYSLTNAVH
jgi:type IV pilus assembly protein PilC